MANPPVPAGVVWPVRLVSARLGRLREAPTARALSLPDRHPIDKRIIGMTNHSLTFNETF